MPTAPAGLPPEQQALRDRCFHPSGTFVELEEAAIEQSIPARFEDQVRRHAARLAIETPDRAITYAELNESAPTVAEMAWMVVRQKAKQVSARL